MSQRDQYIQEKKEEFKKFLRASRQLFDLPEEERLKIIDQIKEIAEQ